MVLGCDLGTKTIITNSPEETMQLSCSLAKNLVKRDLVALEGDLGAGKTVFVKGLAMGLGVEDHFHVNSPTFVIMKEYSGKTDLYHFDVYRLDERSFEDTIDYKKYFYGEGITIVEWADKIKSLLPEEHILVKLSHLGEEQRKIEVIGKGERLNAIAGRI